MENIITQIAENSDELEKDYASLDKLKSESSRQSERLNALLDSKQQELASNSDDITKFEELALQYEQQLDDLLESLNLSFGTDISKYKLDKE